MATTKKITVNGVDKVKLSSEYSYHKWLERQGVTSLLDNENYQVDFESLVTGENYKLGPPQQQQLHDQNLQQLVVSNTLQMKESINALKTMMSDSLTDERDMSKANTAFATNLM
mmetsp:Transcript_9811/g.14439  ORF Transcript_9811/g.14439 Transcript_9811/m.14439 type:complete len:114 (-) Transcript_9811:799-1140(-)